MVYRVAINLENLANLKKSGNWKFIKKIREKEVREFIKKIVESGKYLANVSVQIYSGWTSILFLTWLQIILNCLCWCCHYSKYQLKCLNGNANSIIFFELLPIVLLITTSGSTLGLFSPGKFRCKCLCVYIYKHIFVFILATTQQSSATYDLQTEIYDKMVSYNTTSVSPLCHNWKVWICFDLSVFWD